MKYNRICACIVEYVVPDDAPPGIHVACQTYTQDGWSGEFTDLEEEFEALLIGTADNGDGHVLAILVRTYLSLSGLTHQEWLGVFNNLVEEYFGGTEIGFAGDS